MFKDQAPKPKRGSVDRARRQRGEMSLPEVLLWQVLRKAPNGLRFRRQHPTGPYSLDFYCIDARLAVEVDGEFHARGDRPTRDERRDAWLAGNGIETLRIPVREVLADLDAVVRGIVAEARSHLPLNHPASPGGPRPRDKLGEE